jgi:hypothetical protein
LASLALAIVLAIVLTIVIVIGEIGDRVCGVFLIVQIGVRLDAKGFRIPIIVLIATGRGVKGVGVRL